ncbi:MAG: inositol monophosphatase [Alphaproteobacteria bacterium]|nr:inositol monophosphatase [Alphaproteobacteria bacterium]
MISVKLPNQSSVMTVMTKAAVKASRGLLRDFTELENLQVSVKSNRTFVTAADLHADRILRKELSFARPKYSMLTEESQEIQGEDPSYKWIVDPLDGTVNYMHGFPHWAVSIALKKDSEIIAAVTYDPVKNEMFWAEKGCGAYMNDRKIRVSRKKEISDLLISFGASCAGSSKALVQSIRRTGSTTLDMAYLAAGRIDILYGTSEPNEWDVAAGLLLIKEAGGVLADKEGHPTSDYKKTMIMTNVDLLPLASKLLSQ